MSCQPCAMPRRRPAPPQCDSPTAQKFVVVVCHQPRAVTDIGTMEQRTPLRHVGVHVYRFLRSLQCSDDLPVAMCNTPPEDTIENTIEESRYKQQEAQISKIMATMMLCASA
eukprot:PhM_4_TR13334/c1_g3_i12/m.17493